MRTKVIVKCLNDFWCEPVPDKAKLTDEYEIEHNGEDFIKDLCEELKTIFERHPITQSIKFEIMNPDSKHIKRTLKDDTGSIIRKGK